MKKNKLFCFLLLSALFALCFCVPAFAADGEIDIDFGDILNSLKGSGACGESLLWNFDGKGVLTISGSGYMYDYEAADDRPWKYASDIITEVVVEDGVESIGDNAFSDFVNVECVVLPVGVESIGNGAFLGCTSLEYVFVPQSVSEIGENVFEQTNAGFSVYVHRGSFVEEFAKENDISLSYVGDLDGDGDVNLEDAILLLQYSMFPEDFPIEDYALSVDLNSDGGIDLDDAILLLQHSMFPEDYPI